KREVALTIQAAEAESDRLYVAGEAAPGSSVRVYADTDFVGEVLADENGQWLVEAPRIVPLGELTIRADAAAPASAVAVAEAELAFVRHPNGIVLEPAAAPPGADGEVAQGTAAVRPPTYVIIRRGDNLWRISRRNYGRGIRYKTIFAANRELIRNPHLIFPGQVFVVPKGDRGWGTATN
ncbi:MAG TPA: LysM peptidoglycan-binding domain-containing protein, partial [Propylenella sp.]|nr:LysM peptidoglycan-binding domain-containing protein [Propylenella sp.]